MREIGLTLLLGCLTSVAVPALAGPEAIVTPLVAKDLPEFQGKEGVMILVEYPPGASDPIHRHNAYAFVYVLEGSVVMQLRDATRPASGGAARIMHSLLNPSDALRAPNPPHGAAPPHSVSTE